MMTHDDEKQITDDFHAAVNMAPAELEAWLKTEDSRSVGWADGTNKTEAGGPEAVGHKEGRRIVAIQPTKKAELTAQDFADMKKVVGYIHRHMAQRPSGDVEHSRWRYSLMNWGCDPTKD